MNYKIPSKFRKMVIYRSPSVSQNSLDFVAINDSVTIKLATSGSPQYTPTIQYSINGGSWTNYTLDTDILLNQNDKISFRNTTSHLNNSTSDYYYFASTGNGSLNVSGYLNAMINGNDMSDDYTYAQLFMGNAKIVDTSQLIIPSSDIKVGCYKNMFYGCTNLSTTVSSLPALTLEDSCYFGMFGNCRHLLNAPEILATELADDSCNSMFMGCIELSTMSVDFTSWTDYTNSTDNWMFSIPTSGTFYKPSALPTIYGDDYIPSAWTVVNKEEIIHISNSIPDVMFEYQNTRAIDAFDLNNYITYQGLYSYSTNLCTQLPNGITFNDGVFYCNQSTISSYQYVDAKVEITAPDSPVPVTATVILETEPDCSNEPLTFRARNSNTSVKLSGFGSPSSITLKYRKNGGSWSNYTVGNVIQLRAFETVSFSGANTHFSGPVNTSPINYYKFVGSGGDMYLYGKLNSLNNNRTTIDTKAEFTHLFTNFTTLKRARQFYLPATTLSAQCYQWMFGGCQNLEYGPKELPATTLKPTCYVNMFKNCYKLKQSPFIKATVLDTSSLEHMFQDCYQLEKVTVNFTQWYWDNLFATYEWLLDANDQGTIYKWTSLSETPRDESHIPQWWDIEYLN